MAQIRVMLASEYPETRSLIMGIVETDNHTVIVGQAENAFRALDLARNLRPDVAIIDSYLPYAVGVDAMPLTRAGGLDIAQAISEEIPNIRVVLLNSLDEKYLPDVRWGQDNGISFCREDKQACVPFTLGELYQDRVGTPGALVFARVIPNTSFVVKRRTGQISDKAIFFGSLCFFGGWVLVVTLFLSVPGVILAAAGALTAVAGLGAKLISKIRK